MTKIQLRHDTSTKWEAANPILAPGEVGVETDTQKIKVGNGSTAYNSLQYIGTTRVTNETNLNNIIEPGTYYFSGTRWDNLTNKPFNDSSHTVAWMIVISYNRGNTAQILFSGRGDYSDCDFAIRYRISSNWNSWHYVRPTSVLSYNVPNGLVVLNSSGKLPAVDGSQLTNLPSATPSNMVTTDTNQNITGSKKFTGTYPNQTSTAGFNFPNSTAAEIRISPNGSDHSLFGVTNNTLYIQPGYTVEHFYINNYKDDSSESGIASTVEIAGILYNKLNNVKSKILTTADNGTIANLGMPSMSAFTDETLPASGTATTATEPGYLYIDKTAVAVGEYIQVTVSDSSSNVVYSDDKYAVVADQALKLMVPIPNGCSYTVSYTATGTTNNYRFIKTTGQNA